MIQSRNTAKSQTTVPLAVRRALGVSPGDELVWEVEGDRAVLRRVNEDKVDVFVNNFAAFTEWHDELDAAYYAL